MISSWPVSGWTDLTQKRGHSTGQGHDFSGAVSCFRAGSLRMASSVLRWVRDGIQASPLGRSGGRQRRINRGFVMHGWSGTYLDLPCPRSARNIMLNMTLTDEKDISYAKCCHAGGRRRPGLRALAVAGGVASCDVGEVQGRARAPSSLP
ncbi:hypothetical protein GDI1045 [Gluconacetobacter diazotrophicus PA1 5]|uniref:Uncharacterized protein n=1 Tax=Gluconacetobacter diazotrophicus (strain ATCC 49037 / DSM 5601 / CCUG 37298 / CIP 103539 / LMG 7603 / PAl5) TaxID=272568 RepID=A9HCT0_GLUDA|nr:hypothetical protein GDI1045 [Gluconacetobacter diazotrophicus PA1 5]